MSFLSVYSGPKHGFSLHEFRTACSDEGNRKLFRRVAIIVGGVVAVVRISREMYAMYHNSQLRRKKQESSQEAKKTLKSTLESFHLDSVSVDEITSLSCTELADKLKKRKLKAVDVVRAFQSKALAVDEDVNCICEPILEAEAMAAKADSGEVQGLLHGIPVSLKDSYGLQGYDQTVGSAKHVDKPYAEDAVIVKVMKKQGAVPFCKTNVPQTMLSFMTSNPIFGETLNPHNKDLIPGGSSGGEAALLASNGSVLGFGSDLGGSVRIPANMCGVCALKPTIGRLSKKGMHHLCRANQMIASSLGPMARNVDGLVLAMKSLLVPYMYELDPNLSPILFQNDIFDSKKPLRIGYYTYDGYMHAVPAQVRAVMLAKETLEKKGHTLVPWTPPHSDKAYTDVWCPVALGDNGRGVMKELENEKVDPCIYRLYRTLSIPQKIRRRLAGLFKYISTSYHFEYSAGIDYETVYDWFMACRMLETFREDVASSWVENNLDAVICPGFACPAIPPKYMRLEQIAYAAMYNALNFPAGSIPVSKVTHKDLDDLEATYPTEPSYHRVTKEGSRFSLNMPVNVQCVGLPYKDEICLRVMKELEDGLKK